VVTHNCRNDLTHQLCLRQAENGNERRCQLHEFPRSQVTGLSEAGHSGYEKAKEDQMIVLGLILLILGWVLGTGILVTIGIILLIIGVVFLVLGQMGRAVGGRKYWF
jgi:hypothetical protein